MSFKVITPVKKAKSCVVHGQEYVRLTNKMLFINAGASKYLSSDYIQIAIDKKQEVLKFIPCKKEDENAFKLSTVNETRGARRIETNRALQSIQDNGFPRGKLGKRLPVSLAIDGALLVDYAYHPVPMTDRIRNSEREEKKDGEGGEGLCALSGGSGNAE